LTPAIDQPVSNNRKTDYPIGTIIWQYQISAGYDNSPKAIAAIPDINGDDIDDVVICSEDNNIRCFSGGAIGMGVVLWTHNIYSGNIYSQKGLTITQDVNNDGYNDVVVGATGGARLIRCISGLDAETIWTHDTHEYGGGGWVYQVDCRYDYNNDGVLDVLAATGDDSTGTGPKRAYCLNGLTGVSIWEFPLGGAGFSVIGVEDFTGDGKPDAVSGCTNAAQTIGYAKGINGATGTQVWSFTTPGSSVWAVEQIDDVNGDGISDVIIGDFLGNIYGLNATIGTQLFSISIGPAIITRFEKIGDVNGDGHPDIIPAHSSIHTTQIIDGYTGSIVWSHPVADQPWNVAASRDVSGDAIDDVFVGTLFQNNYCYFLSGVDGSEITSPIPYGEAVDAIAAIPDVVDDGSMEMVVGGRNGKVVCYSGGLNASSSPPSITADFSGTPTEGTAPLTVQFTDLSTAVNTTITSWKWDFDDDGVIDSTQKDPEWTYETEGTYTVSLKVSGLGASDTERKEDYIMVLPPGAFNVTIGTITGGLLRVKAEVLNTGSLDITDMNWSIVLSGGLVILGRNTTGTTSSLPVGESAAIESRALFGFGKVSITVRVELPEGQIATKTVDGTLLLFFLIIRN
ncbi:MAG: hypothetical protein BV458_14000, partial [Thermoplasmata archaeon M9B2D]